MSSLQSLEWLPEVLENAGLKVATVDGWEGRSRPGPFGPIQALFCHTRPGQKSGICLALTRLPKDVVIS